MIQLVTHYETSSRNVLYRDETFIWNVIDPGCTFSNYAFNIEKIEKQQISYIDMELRNRKILEISAPIE